MPSSSRKQNDTPVTSGGPLPRTAGIAGHPSPYYWLKGEKRQNFGDFLTEYYMTELFYPLGMKAHGIHITGSVVDDLFVPPPAGDADANPTGPIVFWGCGLRDAEGPSPDRRPQTEILDIRGPLCIPASSWCRCAARRSGAPPSGALRAASSQGVRRAHGVRSALPRPAHGRRACQPKWLPACSASRALPRNRRRFAPSSMRSIPRISFCLPPCIRQLPPPFTAGRSPFGTTGTSTFHSNGRMLRPCWDTG